MSDNNKDSSDYKEGYRAGYTGKLHPRAYSRESAEFKEKYRDYLAGLSDGYDSAVEETFSQAMEQVS